MNELIWSMITGGGVLGSERDRERRERGERGREDSARVIEELVTLRLARETLEGG